MALSLRLTRRFGLVACLVFVALEAVRSRLDVIDLPIGFFPEGIVRGDDEWTAYVGSLVDGSIWKGDLFTGVGEVVVTGDGGITAAGLDYDPRSGYLFVAGGASGARIYNDKFRVVAEYDFDSADESSFVNDVIVTQNAAYFTDSFQARLYAVELNLDDGGLANGPDLSAYTIPLSSDFPVVEGEFNANGIEANEDGSTLIVANSYAGKLFTVDPVTGNATAIDLGGAVVTADGLVLRQNTLWAIENGGGGGPQHIKEIFETAALVSLFALSVRGFVAPSPRVTGSGGVGVQPGTGCRGRVQCSRRPSLERLGAQSEPRLHDDKPIGGPPPRNSRAKKAQSVNLPAESMRRWVDRPGITEAGSSTSTSSSTTRERFLEAGSTAVAAAFGATVLGAVGLPSGAAFGARVAGIESAGAVEPSVAEAAITDSPALLEIQILTYVREALPAWRPLPDSDIELKQITGGITNVIFKARNAVTGEGALVRVYGKDTDLLLDRRKEAAVFSELSTLGFGPRKLGEFKEGRVEELLNARAATPAELLETRPFDVPRAIAAQLASLHGQRVQSSAGSPTRPVMWTTIDRWLETATRLDVSKAFPLDTVAAEVAWLKEHLPDTVGERASSPSPAQKLAAEIADGTVFAHNDLLSGNVLVGPRGAKQISTLRLIDFEYSDYNPCGYDIANHFCECAGFDADFRHKYPSVAQRRRFLEAYVEAVEASRRKPDALTESDPSRDDLLRELVTRVDRYTLASHLTWGLWAIIQANTSEIEGFDFAGYAKKRLDGYTFHKGQFFA